MDVTLTRGTVYDISLDKGSRQLTVTIEESSLTVDLNRSSVNVLQAGGIGYEHTQSIPSALWHIEHGLGYKPGGIVVKDSADNQFFIDNVTYIDNNSLDIHLGESAFSGKAYIS